MPNYLVKKVSKTGEIIYMQYRLDGYEFKPRNKAKASVSLDKITIIKPSMIDLVLTQKIDNKIKIDLSLLPHRYIFFEKKYNLNQHHHLLLHRYTFHKIIKNKN